MSDAEKAARLCTDLDQCSLIVEYDLSKPIAENMREAAALIRRLQAESDTKDALRMQGEAQVASLLVEIASLRAENEALRVKQVELVEALQPFTTLETDLCSTHADDEQIEVFEGVTAGHIRRARAALAAIREALQENNHD
jgi:hypothetical protein